MRLNGLWSKNGDWMEWLSGVDTISTTVSTRAPSVLKCCWRGVTTHIPSISICTPNMWQNVDLLEYVDGPTNDVYSGSIILG